MIDFIRFRAFAARRKKGRLEGWKIGEEVIGDEGLWQRWNVGTSERWKVSFDSAESVELLANQRNRLDQQ